MPVAHPQPQSPMVLMDGPYMRPHQDQIYPTCVGYDRIGDGVHHHHSGEMIMMMGLDVGHFGQIVVPVLAVGIVVGWFGLVDWCLNRWAVVILAGGGQWL